METKTVYAYAAEDGAYLGEHILDDTDRSPVSGAWQIPANMTEDKPPHPKDGYDLYHRGGKWEQTKRPKPVPEHPSIPDEPAEPYIDEERLAAFEAVAAQEARLAEYEARITALEAALKGGEGK